MAQQVRQTETSTMIKATKVADYIVERLAAEGISHCFGVAGDYVFPICDAVDSSPKVKWIGCANELNASYAADGYARIRGAAMLATTYGVGELSALNGVMGAKAERSLVFHVVGMPSYQHQRVGKIAHHTLGDGVFGHFVDLSGSAACCHAIITPENCVLELERVIAEAKRNNQPAYIAVPSDHALSPVVPVEVKPTRPRSNEAALQKAMAIIAERINKAEKVVAFPAFTISRLGLQSEYGSTIGPWSWGRSSPPRNESSSTCHASMPSPRSSTAATSFSSATSPSTSCSSAGRRASDRNKSRLTKIGVCFVNPHSAMQVQSRSPLSRRCGASVRKSTLQHSKLRRFPQRRRTPHFSRDHLTATTGIR